MKKLVFVTIVILCIISCNTSHTSKPPQWVKEVTPTSGYLYGVGQAEGERESVINALSELYCNVIKFRDSSKASIEDEFQSGQEIIIPIKVGEIEIKALIKKFDDSTIVEKIVTISFLDDGRVLEYKQYTVQQSGITDEYTLSITEKGYGLEYLINELEIAGCTVEFYSDGMKDYTLIKCNVKAINRYLSD